MMRCKSFCSVRLGLEQKCVAMFFDLRARANKLEIADILSKALMQITKSNFPDSGAYLLISMAGIANCKN